MSTVTRPARDTPPFDLAVCVGDDVRGLSRVVNVLALLEITPLELSVEGRDARLGVARLRALPCVRSARLSSRNAEAATSLAVAC
jgi:hypothetical protein